MADKNIGNNQGGNPSGIGDLFIADKREQIRRILNAYPTIIDFDESKEVYHLFMDLVSVMEED